MKYFRVTLSTNKIIAASDRDDAREKAMPAFKESLDISFGDIATEPITKEDAKDEAPWLFD